MTLGKSSSADSDGPVIPLAAVLTALEECCTIICKCKFIFYEYGMSIVHIDTYKTNSICQIMGKKNQANSLLTSNRSSISQLSSLLLSRKRKGTINW